MKTVLEKAKVEESVFFSISSLPFKRRESHFVDHAGLKLLSYPPASVAETYRCRTNCLLIVHIYFWKGNKALP